ncbi:MAG: hypothetical protein IKP38_05040 [Clostridia bacterium]|nr:hypothetical protein [Clostridia bacterium]
MKSVLNNEAIAKRLLKEEMITEEDLKKIDSENEQHAISVAQTLYLKSINGWLTFFGVLTILGLIGGLITIIAVFE